MAFQPSLLLLHAVVSLILINLCPLQANEVETKAFLSPPIYMTAGSVANKMFYDIEFPKGHIGLKSFNAELVDEHGRSVPLSETYLHHWVVIPYLSNISSVEKPGLQHHFLRNSGTCQADVLGQYFGVGAETRGTLVYIPDPFAVEVGNPVKIPEGQEVRWLINVHAIDTRGVVDRVGCAECRCDLYNVTSDVNGNPIPKAYKGGLLCCDDQTTCRLKGASTQRHRELYLKYTIQWVKWSASVHPARIYVLDVTDSGNRTGSAKKDAQLGCQVEYDVMKCKRSTKCMENRKTRLLLPNGGDVIFAVGHQHIGGAGTALYGQDGRIICTSIPTYGKGKRPGNEDGYVIGMSVCTPKRGFVQIADREILTLESNYSSKTMHTGVMGLFLVVIADVHGSHGAVP